MYKCGTSQVSFTVKFEVKRTTASAQYFCDSMKFTLIDASIYSKTVEDFFCNNWAAFYKSIFNGLVETTFIHVFYEKKKVMYFRFSSECFKEMSGRNFDDCGLLLLKMIKLNNV